MSFITLNVGEMIFKIVNEHHNYFWENKSHFNFLVSNTESQSFICSNCKCSKIDIDLKDIIKNDRPPLLPEEYKKQLYYCDGYKFIYCNECNSTFLIGIGSHEFCNNGWYQAIDVIYEVEEIINSA